MVLRILHAAENCVFSGVWRSVRLETARISIALAIHSLDPTKDAISDSAQYNLSAILIMNLPSD